MRTAKRAGLFVAHAVGVLMYGAAGRSEIPDAGTRDVGAPNASVRPSTPSRPTFHEVLHHVGALSTLTMRCRATGEDSANEKPLDRMACAFATVTLRQQAPEKMATLENYGEILRELRAQCRAQSPRSEPARMACAACRRGDYTEACLYEQAMRELRKGCASEAAPRTHANPAVAALLQAEAARGTGNAQVMERFCKSCTSDPSASCFSAFWSAIEPPARCSLAMDGYEVELTRQGKTSTWSANLGGPCNTQVTLARDERRKVWTYTEIWLSPEPCARGESQKPALYSSAPGYALPDLPAKCEQLTFP